MPIQYKIQSTNNWKKYSKMPLERPQTAGRQPAVLPRPKMRNKIRHSLSKRRL